MALVDQYLYILWGADIPGSERCGLAFLIDIKRWEWSDTVISMFGVENETSRI